MGGNMYKIKEGSKEQKMICRNDVCIVLDMQVKRKKRGVVGKERARGSGYVKFVIFWCRFAQVQVSINLLSATPTRTQKQG
jgi:hypothetical protein